MKKLTTLFPTILAICSALLFLTFVSKVDERFDKIEIRQATLNESYNSAQARLTAQFKAIDQLNLERELERDTVSTLKGLIMDVVDARRLGEPESALMIRIDALQAAVQDLQERLPNKGETTKEATRDPEDTKHLFRSQAPKHAPGDLPTPLMQRYSADQAADLKAAVEENIREELRDVLAPIVSAIGVAEGLKAPHYFGVLNPKAQGFRAQAGWCAATVQKNYDRWTAAGKPGEFLEWFGNIYCPIGAENDPKGLNKNWLPNVTGLLASAQ